MAKIDKQKMLETINSGDEEHINRMLDDIINRLNTKKYGLVWEEGGNDEDSPFETENIVKQAVANIPVPRLRKDLSTNIEQANGNMLLEGDNYAWLKVLEQTHSGTIQVIYIDPNYNTGKKDFKYNDSFVGEDDVFKHSKWLSFMKNRLTISKNLLSDDGVIFISIDDHEYAQLKMLCDELFGPKNYIATFIWKKQGGGKSDSKFVASNCEYILCYKKNSLTEFSAIQKDDTHYKDVDENGRRYHTEKLDRASLSYSANLDYPIEIDGETIYPGGSYEQWLKRQNGEYSQKDWCWRCSRPEFERRWAEGKFIIKTDKKTGLKTIQEKVYLKEGGVTGRMDTLITDYTNRLANNQVKNIFNSKPFTYPKPTNLIKDFIKLYPADNITVLDFFAGSGTTAHAVMELNEEDGGNRHWILVTNNEDQENDDGNPETGICRDVTKPRIDTVITGKRLDGSTYSDGITNTGYAYYQYDWLPRSDCRESNQAGFLTAGNIDNMVQLKYGVHSIAADKDIRAIVYENDSKNVIVFYDEFNEEFFMSHMNINKKNIVLSNNTFNIDGATSLPFTSLFSTYDFLA